MLGSVDWLFLIISGPVDYLNGIASSAVLLLLLLLLLYVYSSFSFMLFYIFYVVEWTTQHSLTRLSRDKTWKERVNKKNFHHHVMF